MDAFQPPLPPRPDFEAKPRVSPLWWLVAAFGGLGLLGGVALLAAPVLWVAFAIALIISLQYVLWGWWFERMYRSQPPADVVADVVDAKDAPAKPWERRE